MYRSPTICILVIFMFGICYDTYGEIHRARGIKPRGITVKVSTPRATWPPGPHRPVETQGRPPSCADPGFIDDEHHFPTEGATENDSLHSTVVWTYAIISALLVGLSGIFPLLIIPLEAGEALKHGAPAARLKLLLSFAVGGLLGDVFLHLLPEAWAHLDAEEFHAGHTRIGMWVIIGLLSFLIIEKMFPDNREEEDDDDAETDKQYTKLSSRTEEPFLEQSTSYNLRSRSTNTTHKSNIDNGHPQCNGDSSTFASNGHVGNGDALQDTAYREEKHTQRKEHRSDKSVHIKTTGYLNLLANVIDNFTHGLAVAGSYCCGIKVGLLTTCAILLHEIPHEMGDFAILLRSGFDRWQAAKAQLCTSMGGLVGALTALSASSVQQAGDSTAWILPFTSGGFIYIALVTVVPDLLKEKNPRESFKQVLLLILGILTMAMVTLLSE